AGRCDHDRRLALARRQALHPPAPRGPRGRAAGRNGAVRAGGPELMRRRIAWGMAAAALLWAMPAAAQPDLSGFWNLSFEPGEPDTELVAKLPPDTVLIEDTGVVEFPVGEFGGLKLKPEALARAQAWRPDDDMTISRVCLAPSI